MVRVKAKKLVSRSKTLLVLVINGRKRVVPTSQKVKFVPNPKKPGCEAWRRYKRYGNATTVAEALKLGAAFGDLHHDFRHGYLQLVGYQEPSAAAEGSKPENAEGPKPLSDVVSGNAYGKPFGHVVSFGGKCVVAKTLNDMKLRKYSGPFDWIHSTAEMVQSCLQDDFATFLDQQYIFATGHNKGYHGHKIYSKMVGRDIIFQHQDPKKKDREQFLRSTLRMRRVLGSRTRKLFVLSATAGAEAGPMPGSSKEQLEQLVQYLMRTQRVRNFELLAIHILKGNASSAKKVPLARCIPTCSDHLRLIELHCVGGNTGLVFKKSADTEAFRSLIAGRLEKESARGGRRFQLLASPIPPSQSATSKRKYSDIDHSKRSAPARKRASAVLKRPSVSSKQKPLSERKKSVGSAAARRSRGTASNAPAKRVKVATAQ